MQVQQIIISSRTSESLAEGLNSVSSLHLTHIPHSCNVYWEFSVLLCFFVVFYYGRDEIGLFVEGVFDWYFYQAQMEVQFFFFFESTAVLTVDFPHKHYWYPSHIICSSPHRCTYHFLRLRPSFAVWWLLLHSLNLLSLINAYEHPLKKYKPLFWRVALRMSICITSIQMRAWEIIPKDSDADRMPVGNYTGYWVWPHRFSCPPPTPHSALPILVESKCVANSQFSQASLRSLHTHLAWSQVLFSNTLSLLLASWEGGVKIKRASFCDACSKSKF